MRKATSEIKKIVLDLAFLSQKRSCFSLFPSFHRRAPWHPLTINTQHLQNYSFFATPYFPTDICTTNSQYLQVKNAFYSRVQYTNTQLDALLTTLGLLKLNATATSLGGFSETAATVLVQYGSLPRLDRPARLNF